MILFNYDKAPGREDLLSAVQPVPDVSKDLSASFFSADMFYDRPKNKISVTDFG
jgi:hypothetical protein